jgi:hypothetical protein
MELKVMDEKNLTHVGNTFKTLCDADPRADGTSLQGYIDATYFEIVYVFGEPSSYVDDYNVNVEWIIQFDDGTIATIYNYKDGPKYGDPDCWSDIKEKDSCWHIGGKSIRAVELVYIALAIRRPEQLSGINTKNGSQLMAKKHIKAWMKGSDTPTSARFNVYIGNVKVNANLDEYDAKALVERINKELDNG